MSDNENPIHAPVAGGRPREGDEPRVSRTITMAAASNRALDLNLALLRKLKPHASPGHVLDRMVTFCEAHGFNIVEPSNSDLKRAAREALSTLKSAGIQKNVRVMLEKALAEKKPAQATTPAPAPATSGKA